MVNVDVVQSDDQRERPGPPITNAAVAGTCPAAIPRRQRLQTCRQRSSRNNSRPAATTPPGSPGSVYGGGVGRCPAPVISRHDRDGDSGPGVLYSDWTSAADDAKISGRGSTSPLTEHTSALQERKFQLHQGHEAVWTTSTPPVSSRPHHRQRNHTNQLHAAFPAATDIRSHGHLITRWRRHQLHGGVCPTINVTGRSAGTTDQNLTETCNL
jgi:hypothetical protein